MRPLFAQAARMACISLIALDVSACSSAPAASAAGADAAAAQDVGKGSLFGDTSQPKADVAAPDVPAAAKDVPAAVVDAGAGVDVRPDVPELPDVLAVPDIQAPPDVPSKPDVAAAPDLPPPPADISTTEPDAASADPPCPQTVPWLLGDSLGEVMHPGRACITCHAQKGKKIFTVAGTVYGCFHVVDDSSGVSGATVELTGADGQVTKLTTNLSGNFTYTGALALPYTARVLQGGKSRDMMDPKSNGNCNECHTQNGDQGAPGRITLP